MTNGLPPVTMFRLVATVLLLLCVRPVALSQQPAEWKKFRSTYFSLYTDRTESDAREVLEQLERLRTAYRSLTSFSMEDPEVTRVVLFRDKKEYQRFALGTFSEAYYMNARDRNHIVLSGLDRNAQLVMNHEYFHLFSRHAGFQLPLWLEEGLADTYSTMRFGKNEVSVGLPVQNHLRFLNRFDSTPVPLTRLFAVNPANRNFADHTSTLVFYAQSWALAHMTFLGQDMHARSDEFLRQIRAGVSSEAAYKTVYGLSLEEVEERLARYVRQRRYQYAKRPMQALGEGVSVRQEEPEAWEIPLLLADLMAFTGRGAEAAQRYQELGNEHPAVAEIDEAQGYLAALQLDRSRAAKHFQDAAAKGSTSDRTYHQLALLSCNYQRYEARCQQWIERTLQLNPHNSQARRWAIGYTLNARRFEEALALMRGVPGVDSREAPQFFFQMAYAYANLEQMDDARAAIRRGKEFAQDTRDLRRLDELARMIESAADYQQQIATLDDQGREPLLTQNHDEVDAAAAQEAPAQRTLFEAENVQEALDLFLAKASNRAQSVTLLRMDCNPEGPALLVDHKGANLRLLLDDPHSVIVFRGGERVEADDLRCGSLERRPALVGYMTNDLPDGADGMLRVLSFQ